MTTYIQIMKDKYTPLHYIKISIQLAINYAHKGDYNAMSYFLHRVMIEADMYNEMLDYMRDYMETDIEPIPIEEVCKINHLVMEIERLAAAETESKARDSKKKLPD